MTASREVHSTAEVELDVRGADASSSILTVLERLAALGPGARLKVHHHREPAGLIEKLTLRGYRASCVGAPDGHCVVHVTPSWIAPSAGQGRIAELLAADHDRLDALLARAVSDPDTIDHEAYLAFRAGLARHIGMEEKILVPAARKASGGVPVPHFDRIRSDHGALVARLVPSPTHALVAEIRAILRPHNALEEEPGGVYETCERWLGPGVDTVLSELARAPEVPMRPYHDGRPRLRTALGRGA